MNTPVSLAGTPAASPLGYYSWTFGQFARDPYYIMVVIYLFFPYFSNVVVGDPVRGQSLIGYLNATAGVILAITAPFLGAIADKNGRRKPWVGITVAFMSLGACLLWFVEPAGEGLGVTLTLALLLAISVAFSTVNTREKPRCVYVFDSAQSWQRDNLGIDSLVQEDSFKL